MSRYHDWTADPEAAPQPHHGRLPAGWGERSEDDPVAQSFNLSAHEANYVKRKLGTDKPDLVAEWERRCQPRKPSGVSFAATVDRSKLDAALAAFQVDSLKIGGVDITSYVSEIRIKDIGSGS